MRFDKTKFDEFSIRVPKELTELIQRDADQNKRSRNLQVNVILENYYDRIEREEKTSPQSAGLPAAVKP